MPTKAMLVSTLLLAVLAGAPAAAKNYSGPCHRADLDASPFRVIAVCTLELHRGAGRGTYKADLLARRAHAFNRLGLTASAKHDTTRALEADYMHVSARIRRGYARFWTGEFQAGFRDFEDGLLIDPDCAPCHVGIAAMHAWAGRSNQAIKAQGEAIAIDPHDAQARYIQALYLETVGDRTAAREQLDIALAGGPRAVAGRWIYGNVTTKLDLYVELLTLSARLGIRMRDNTRALADASALLSYAPDIARSHAVMGWVRSVRGEAAEARAALDTALSLEPRDPFVLWENVRFFERLERPLEAIDHLRMLVSVEPRNARPRIFLALFLRDGGMFDDAAYALMEAWVVDRRVRNWFTPHLASIGFIPQQRAEVTDEDFIEGLAACAMDLRCGRNLIRFGKDLP